MNSGGDPIVTDVVVVGLGPAGIIAAAVLADGGLSVTAIQADARDHLRAPLVSPPPTLRSTAVEEAIAQATAQAGLDGVGGSKRLAAPQAYRLDAWSLRTRSATLSRYGALPSDADLTDWPIELEELARWYDVVEHATAVGPRPATVWTERMNRAAATLGWSPFPAPAAAQTDASFLLDGRGVHIVRASVTEILRGSTGEVTGVVLVDADGSQRSLNCGVVVVAASVIPTVRLLLLSGITGADVVGRWFMSHNAFVVHGDFDGQDLGRRHAGPATAVAVDAFEGDRFDHTGVGFLGGSILQAAMTGTWPPERLADAAVGLGVEATRGADALDWVRAHQASIGTVWAQPDQLPRRQNAIDLDPTHRDVTGRPVARVTFSLAPDDVRRWEFLAARMTEWLDAAGARCTWMPPLAPQPLGTHLYGGVRMGIDPRTSAVDSYGRFHDVPGLVVVGSSTFPTTGGRGPLETIEALTWRNADHLAAELR
ncbi:GMC oxidoreductase [Lacisediminihabitans profunda]|uniref:GMC oxidoreductase n=1 Tax=Lacisediminihabitans profunda TaxID=2594790 RepID=UPI001650346D|nr:GMC family oxidoreductase [Lacisediminihabitans profunda]